MQRLGELFNALVGSLVLAADPLLIHRYVDGAKAAVGDCVQRLYVVRDGRSIFYLLIRHLIAVVVGRDGEDVFLFTYLISIFIPLSFGGDVSISIAGMAVIDCELLTIFPAHRGFHHVDIIYIVLCYT